MSTKAIKISDHVIATTKEQPAVKGTVAYIGETEFAAGIWVGIKLKDPIGKNNGTVKGRVYFVAPENCGLFVKQANVRLDQDFPKMSATQEPHVLPISVAQAAHAIQLEVSERKSSSTKDREPESTQAASKSDVANVGNIIMSIGRSMDLDVTTRASADTVRSGPIGEIAEESARSHSVSEDVAVAAALSSTSLPNVMQIPHDNTAEELGSQPAQLQETGAKPNTGVVENSERERVEAIRERDEAQKKAEEFRKEVDHLRAASTQLHEALRASRTSLELSKKSAEDAEIAHKAVLSSVKSKEHDASARASVLKAKSDAFEERLAQMTASMDELKLAAAEARYLKQKVDEQEGMIEELTVAKELAEEELQEARAEKEEAKSALFDARLRIKLFESNATTQSSGAEANSASEIELLQKKIIELSTALHRLHESSVREKTRFETRLASVEKELGETREKLKPSEDTAAALRKSEIQVQALQEQLVDASSMPFERMVEQLTAETYSLAERNSELSSQVKHLLALHEASEDVENGHVEIERELQGEISALNASLTASENALRLKEREIMKLRQLVQQLQTSLRQSEGVVSSAHSSSLATADSSAIDDTSDRATNNELLEWKSKCRSTTKRIRGKDRALGLLELRLCEANQLRFSLDFASLYAPDSVTKDAANLSFFLRLDRILFKSLRAVGMVARLLRCDLLEYCTSTGSGKLPEMTESDQSIEEMNQTEHFAVLQVSGLQHTARILSLFRLIHLFSRAVVLADGEAVKLARELSQAQLRALEADLNYMWSDGQYLLLRAQEEYFTENVAPEFEKITARLAHDEMTLTEALRSFFRSQANSLVAARGASFEIACAEASVLEPTNLLGAAGFVEDGTGVLGVTETKLRECLAPQSSASTIFEILSSGEELFGMCLDSSPVPLSPSLVVTDLAETMNILMLISGRVREMKNQIEEYGDGSETRISDEALERLRFLKSAINSILVVLQDASESCSQIVRKICDCLGRLSVKSESIEVESLKGAFGWDVFIHLIETEAEEPEGEAPTHSAAKAAALNGGPHFSRTQLANGFTREIAVTTRRALREVVVAYLRVRCLSGALTRAAREHATEENSLLLLKQISNSWPSGELGLLRDSSDARWLLLARSSLASAHLAVSSLTETLHHGKAESNRSSVGPSASWRFAMQRCKWAQHAAAVRDELKSSAEIQRDLKACKDELAQKSKELYDTKKRFLDALAQSESLRLQLEITLQNEEIQATRPSELSDAKDAQSQATIRALEGDLEKANKFVTQLKKRVARCDELLRRHGIETHESAAVSAVLRDIGAIASISATEQSSETTTQTQAQNTIHLKEERNRAQNGRIEYEALTSLVCELRQELARMQADRNNALVALLLPPIHFSKSAHTFGEKESSVSSFGLRALQEEKIVRKEVHDIKYAPLVVRLGASTSVAAELGSRQLRIRRLSEKAAHLRSRFALIRSSVSDSAKSENKDPQARTLHTVVLGGESDRVVSNVADAY